MTSTPASSDPAVDAAVIAVGSLRRELLSATNADGSRAFTDDQVSDILALAVQGRL